MGQIPGPSGTQQLTITIGTGNSDRAVMKGAVFNCPFGGCDLTVTNNLGSSATVFLGKPTY
jgi:hypothetical protein